MTKLFLTSSASAVMDDIAKHFSKPPKGLKVAFVNTASEVEKGDLSWLYADRDSLVKQGFEVFDYSLTNKTYEEVSEALIDVDVLFVAGGNTFYLLEQAQKCNFKKIVEDLLKKDIVYIGSSAGSLLVCKNIEPIKYLDDPNKATELKSFNALGLVDFIMFPHWGHERFKERQMKSVEAIYAENHKVILLRDNQYVLVNDDNYKIVDIN